jgi:hypothetical protein
MPIRIIVAPGAFARNVSSIALMPGGPQGHEPLHKTSYVTLPCSVPTTS